MNTIGRGRGEQTQPAASTDAGEADLGASELLGEIQQPLTGIRGFAHLLLDKVEPGLRDHAAAILAQVERIDQLLAAHRRRLLAGGAGKPPPARDEPPSPPPARPAILVVDDEEVMRSLLVSLLEPEGYAVHLAETGDEALRRIQEQRFDLILSDKNLPGATGLQIARAARAKDRGTPVILMTGYASLETAQEGLELGLVDYLEKPFDDIAEVRRRVREVLERPPAAPLASAAGPGERRRLVVLVEDRPEDAARISEAVLAAGGRPQVARTVIQALGLVSSEHAAGIVLSLDLEEGAPSREAMRQLRACADALVTVCEKTSMEQTILAIRMGASACLPRALASAQVLAKELARLFPLGAPDKK